MHFAFEGVAHRARQRARLVQPNLVLFAGEREQVHEPVVVGHALGHVRLAQLAKQKLVHVILHFVEPVGKLRVLRAGQAEDDHAQNFPLEQRGGLPRHGLVGKPRAAPQQLREQEFLPNIGLLHAQIALDGGVFLPERLAGGENAVVFVARGGVVLSHHGKDIAHRAIVPLEEERHQHDAHQQRARQRGDGHHPHGQKRLRENRPGREHHHRPIVRARLGAERDVVFAAQGNRLPAGGQIDAWQILRVACVVPGPQHGSIACHNGQQAAVGQIGAGREQQIGAEAGDQVAIARAGHVHLLRNGIAQRRLAKGAVSHPIGKEITALRHGPVEFGQIILVRDRKVILLAQYAPGAIERVGGRFRNDVVVKRDVDYHAQALVGAAMVPKQIHHFGGGKGKRRVRIAPAQREILRGRIHHFVGIGQQFHGVVKTRAKVFRRHLVHALHFALQQPVAIDLVEHRDAQGQQQNDAVGTHPVAHDAPHFAIPFPLFLLTQLLSSLLCALPKPLRGACLPTPL